MRIAVAGATGLVGRHVVETLGAAGHDAVAIARSHGVDVAAGTGLDEALAGVEAVIDVLNSTARERAATEAFFTATTERLLEAERRAGVSHHVVLSIVGLDRVEGNAHYAGKRRQEALALAGPVRATIVRATQFHEFAEMVVGWNRRDGAATVPPLLVQPVAVQDVAELLVEVATRPPGEPIIEIAGPEPQDLVDMARRTLAANGDEVRLVPSWNDGPFTAEMAGNALLPSPGAHLGPTTFDAWLASRR